MAIDRWSIGAPPLRNHSSTKNRSRLATRGRTTNTRLSSILCIWMIARERKSGMALSDRWNEKTTLSVRGKSHP